MTLYKVYDSLEDAEAEHEAVCAALGYPNAGTRTYRAYDIIVSGGKAAVEGNAWIEGNVDRQDLIAMGFAFPEPLGGS